MNDLIERSGARERKRAREGERENKMIDGVNVTETCRLQEDLQMEDPRIPSLKRISYGIVLPTICCFGIVGNILNLIVLTRRNMRGTAYIYMRGYSAAALLALLFCIPFDMRVLIHKETGRWSSWIQAFYHTHLELFLGNGCLGVGVMMLLALTVERYVSVCRPGQHTRPLCGPPHLTVALIPLATFLVYLPNVFREEVATCLPALGEPIIYQKRENHFYLDSLFYQVYKVVLEIVFKVAPTILLAGFNLRIMVVYRRSCERRRRMTLSRTTSNDEDSRTFAEEKRLVLLLGSTSILFLVCVSPMVILNVTLRESNLSHYPYQVFRALANLLEVTNYSITFYIYCLFSEDFRNTLIRTLQWPWRKSNQGGRGLPMKRSSVAKPTTTITTTTTSTPPTTAVATPGHLARASV
ncbi:probable G-protein coupled receptor B0563.6 isoform X1 [Apis laboriosa]|uniref:probable G-protein coupled receptor B0563.6 isoform X1 n=2 Tax=Apis laboriosa TaxID=183418 RepID=UPI001CC48951|nr:probable G-protein coupled receptor B0563.6 isoform X1 [Apis laboriosa]XP_043790976.1 probable G-protein coupled receptor B0563.6 isoform X1 [Apis laboriosa]XP_043790977.1 probable G-protein coupled receptor B0563.6 isoform X1 [Apis laboriosa]XP_043790978.1 probable G-protein coupled receptor B0563.6 isoform X1 [Apis laboriosa]